MLDSVRTVRLRDYATEPFVRIRSLAPRTVCRLEGGRPGRDAPGASNDVAASNHVAASNDVAGGVDNRWMSGPHDEFANSRQFRRFPRIG